MSLPFRQHLSFFFFFLILAILVGVNVSWYGLNLHSLDE